MTYAEFIAQMEEQYGDAGVAAAETSCVTEADCAKGFDHALGLCLPALEEELLASGEM